MRGQCGHKAIKNLLECLRVVFLRLDAIHILAEVLQAFFKFVMLLDVRFHESFLSGVSLDLREEELLFVLVMGVDCFVYALAENHEVCDVFGLGDLLVLQDHGVEVAIEEVVDETHVGRNFEGFFGDLEMLERWGYWKGRKGGRVLTSFEAFGEGMRAYGPSTHDFVMMLDNDNTEKVLGNDDLS
jgi:hypothetical protein